MAQTAIAQSKSRDSVGVDALWSPDDPVAFLKQHLYIPETNAPIELHPEQDRVIRAMFALEGGQFLYSTMVYSSIKKSAKTTIGGGLGLWQGWRIPNGQIYIVGNDLKQADNRMMQAIRYSVEHNPAMKDRARIIRNTIYLDNGTKIEAVPVDAAGEAGSNPTGIFWTEVWGAKQKKHEEMWSEMALSPTRQGDSFKFCESYAGHSGESLILERLYQSGVKEGRLLDPEISPELYVNGRTIVYWNTRKYLPWQIDNPEYYAQEALEKTPSEFSRQHENKWASSTNAFLPIEWYDACSEILPELRPSQPLVIALDAAVSGDCFGIVAGSRRGDLVELRYARKWIPPLGGKLTYTDPANRDNTEYPEGYLRWLVKNHNVVCIVYDEYQLHDFCTRLANEGLGWFEAFPQGAQRMVADKQLYDIIRDQQFAHQNNRDVREHIENADRTDEDKTTMRIVKRDPLLKIDLAVCTSMMAYQLLYLNLG